MNRTEVFINELTQDVFDLTQNYRTWADPDFSALLERLGIGECVEIDGDRLMLQSMHHHRHTAWAKTIKNYPKTIHLFPHNFEKIQKRGKLVALSGETGQPVARLQCQWRSNLHQGQGKSRAFKNHFITSNIVLEMYLCVGATVVWSGINMLPEAGLSNRARGGTLVDLSMIQYANPTINTEILYQNV